MLKILFQISIIDLLYNKTLVLCIVKFYGGSYDTCLITIPERDVIYKDHSFNYNFQSFNLMNKKKLLEMVFFFSVMMGNWSHFIFKKKVACGKTKLCYFH